MRLPFCDHHICALLEEFTKNGKPLDLTISKYLKDHKSIGANDRRLIGETLYGMIRWQSLIGYFCSSAHPLDLLKSFRSLNIEELQKDSKIPPHIRFGLPLFLYRRLVDIYGKTKGEEIALLLTGKAPTTIRINPLKITRDELFEKWKSQFEMTLSQKSPLAIHFSKRIPLFSLPEFKEGLFEVQDESSQLVADLVEAKPGDHVLDYCSGSGGKTLAFAPKLQGKGQIYLHDNRPWILQEARKRLKRAAVQNVQFLLPKKKVDWLLTDVPCTGTGTLRRNPDAKWKIDAPMVERLILQQRDIVKEALVYLKPNGTFVYATCSLLPEENESQIEYFLKAHSLKLEKTLTFFPEEGGGDGFFAAVMKKTTLI